MSTRIALLTVATATLGAMACGPDDLMNPSRPDATEEFPVEVSAESESPVATDLARVVATVDLAHGGAATFLDLGDGHIGIAERAPKDARFASRSMIADLNATPLEVYLALSPRGATVPDLLVRDHQRAAHLRDATSSAGSIVTPPSSSSTLADPGYDTYACDSFGHDWIADWKAAFVGITKYRSAAYAHQQTGTYTFYPGAAVYNGTNTNKVTYLGACNGDAYDDLVMEVHRRISGSWVKVHEATLDSYQKYTFYSGVHASYRGRTHGAGKTTVEHYGFGAAWTLSPPVATP